MIPRKLLKIFRSEEGKFVDGLWAKTFLDENEELVENSFIEFYSRYSVQPTSGEELQLLPEGRQNESSFTLFGSEKLKSVSENTNPDLVEIDGKKYEVSRVDVWQNQILNHYRIIVTKI